MKQIRQDKKTVLVLYFARGNAPLRSTIRSHLECWGKYSSHCIIYVNVAFGFPERLIRNLSVDVVIFHTMLLSLRWMPAIFKKYISKCSYLKTLPCTKVMIPQDEFLHTSVLNDFCNDFGVTHILTNASEVDWRYIYKRVDPCRVRLITVLTGYLDPETLVMIEKARNARNNLRSIDIGYRAWKAEYWLGEHGMHKTRIAEIFKSVADRTRLVSDISLREEDVISGNAWFDYLLRCKATIGVEGGASVLDEDGRIKDRVTAFMKSNPSATFEETRKHCFPGEDGKLNLACISPRHLEACATDTFQFLLEGNYNGILIPWRHYFPIKKDYSNVDDCLAIFSSPDYMHRVTSTAYDEIVASGKWSYPVFVKEIEESIIDAATSATAQKNDFIQHGIRIALKLIDALNWRLIQAERWCMGCGLKTKTGRWTYTKLSKKKGV